MPVFPPSVPMPKKILVALLALAVLVPAASASAQDVPTRETLYDDGPTNRYLMGGQWLHRLDPGNSGLREGFHKQTATDGWEPVTIPNAWNATDESPESMRGTVGWYRKDFRLPSAKSRYDWTLRFESVNYRSRVYI